MSMFVNTNVSSLNAQRQLFDVSNSLGTSFERLSSGFRINSAADDAAGLQITDRMTSQVQGLNQAVTLTMRSHYRKLLKVRCLKRRLLFNVFVH
jgi:flagellin-like hook-associated protein FlgL